MFLIFIAILIGFVTGNSRGYSSAERDIISVEEYLMNPEQYKVDTIYTNSEITEYKVYKK